ncbi:MAG: tetratricopeptide repeat protein [Thermodesulfobacteriota bacterium]
MAKNRILFVCLLLVVLLAVWTLPGLARDARDKGQSQFTLGVFAFENGDYQAAENHFQQALSADGGNPYYNYYMGKVCLQKEDYSRAAVYLEKAAQAGKGLPDLAYNWAYVNYKLNDYAAAGKLFEALTVSEPGNVLAQYYAGLSLYKQEKYQPALTHLNRAAGLETPVRYNADYHAGLCDIKLGDLASARERLTRVQQNAGESELRQSAAALLEKIPQMEREARRYSLTAKLGWEYDDNIALEPIDENDLYADEGDHFFSGYVFGTYDLIKTDTLVMGAGYGQYCTLHDDLDEYDLTASLFDLYARYRLQDYTFAISYNPDYYWLDSESYLCRNEITTTISREFDRFLTEFSYNHQRDNNMYDSDQDGYANEIFFRCQYALPEERGALRAGVGYEVKSADSDDYDYDTVSTELVATFRTWWKVYLGLCGECEVQQYDHANSVYGKKRDDTKYTGNVLLSRNIINEMIAAHIGYEYTKNNSNIDDVTRYNESFEYESNAVKVFCTFQL